MNDDEKKAIIRAAWRRENRSEVPFFIEAGENLKATRSALSDPGFDLARQKSALEASLEVEDYSVPSFKPNIGIGVMAIAFGCPYVLDENADPWVKPLITDDGADALESLKAPDPLRSGLFPLALERIKLFSSQKSVSTRCVNIPSPLLTASLIWEYGSFLTGMMLSPDKVHRLLERVTAATIDFLKIEREKIDNLFAFTHESVYIPPDVAIRVSDDVAAVLSPELYREFGVQYNNLLSREFGGIVVHSCGDVGNALPAMMETEGLVGIDIVAPQNDLSLIKRIACGRTALCLRYFDWDFPFGSNVDLQAYSRYLVEYFGTNGTLLWTHTPTVGEARDLGRDFRESHL